MKNCKYRETVKNKAAQAGLFRFIQKKCKEDKLCLDFGKQLRQTEEKF